jgi:hypothetical protein
MRSGTLANGLKALLWNNPLWGKRDVDTINDNMEKMPVSIEGVGGIEVKQELLGNYLISLKETGDDDEGDDGCVEAIVSIDGQCDTSGNIALAIETKSVAGCGGGTSSSPD